ncbi:MAG: family 2 glycosyl transferase, partial [Clostridium sp.]
NIYNSTKINGVKLICKTSGKDFEIYKNGKWEKTFLKGVSMGAGKPGYYPGEFGITKEEYLRWFKEIKDMNADVIRVYTLHMPAFYEALFEFNRYRVDPLYLIQGVWVDEETMVEKRDVFDDEVILKFKNEINTIIDVLHGNGKVEKDIARGYGEYKRDVSPYVVGYILGIEWDPNVVYETNLKHSKMEQFNGKWLYTENAEPIEIFFGQVGESAIDYEIEKYKTQKAIAFTNWLPTDIIPHENEPEAENRLVDINTQNVKAKEGFEAGLFASYHIYPYYPDFLNFEEKYSEFKDENNEGNSYRAYLRDLISRYDIPVIVGEFGVPTSRGIAHEDLSRGFNQGMIEEKAQGEMNSKMIEEIYDEGYAGALIFTWQDEWFKRAWNTMDYDYSQSRAYWSDRMTNEKYFGLLSFDPGEKRSKFYNDGNVGEWKESNVISEGENLKLYGSGDEGYIYLRINKKDLDLSKEEIIIPIDVTENSGGEKIEGYDFTLNKGWDFFIKISGKEDGEIFVNSYYDIYKFLYEKKIEKDKGSNKYNSIYNFVLGEFNLPKSGAHVDMKGVNVGKLIYGNGNPKSDEFNSLSDFYINGDNIEIRIPYLMLNIADPSTKKILGDFNEKEKIEYESFEGINIGAYVVSNGEVKTFGEMREFSWEQWEMPTYHERLKESYFIIKETYGRIE